MIHENWGDPLLVNKAHTFNSKLRFICSGNNRTRVKQTTEHIEKRKQLLKGRRRTQEEKDKMSKAKLGSKRSKESIEKQKQTVRNKGNQGSWNSGLTKETSSIIALSSQKLSGIRKGKRKSYEHCKSISEALKRVKWTKERKAKHQAACQKAAQERKQVTVATSAIFLENHHPEH